MCVYVYNGRNKVVARKLLSSLSYETLSQHKIICRRKFLHISTHSFRFVVGFLILISSYLPGKTHKGEHIFEIVFIPNKTFLFIYPQHLILLRELHHQKQKTTTPPCHIYLSFCIVCLRLTPYLSCCSLSWPTYTYIYS